jgi:hypothetical protein
MSSSYLTHLQTITLVLAIATIFAVSYTVSGRADAIGVAGVVFGVLVWLGLDQINQKKRKITRILLAAV